MWAKRCAFYTAKYGRRRRQLAAALARPCSGVEGAGSHGEGGPEWSLRTFSPTPMRSIRPPVREQRGDPCSKRSEVSLLLPPKLATRAEYCGGSRSEDVTQDVVGYGASQKLLEDVQRISRS